MKARELIDAGEIGRPLQIRQRHGAWLERERMEGADIPTDRAWRLDPEESGGGEHPWIFDHAVHFFSTAEYFLQDLPVQEVYAVTARNDRLEKRRGAVHDPYQTAKVDIPLITWKYEDPACHGVWMRAERLNGKFDFRLGFSTVIIGERGMIEVLGEGGGNLFWQGEEQHLILHREGRDTRCWRFEEEGDEVWKSEISYYSRGHINQIHYFTDCVVTGQSPRYSGEKGVQAVRCTLAAIRSAQTGVPVKIRDISESFSAYGAE
jgi:predicted dehydrogenase